MRKTPGIFWLLASEAERGTGKDDRLRARLEGEAGREDMKTNSE